MKTTNMPIMTELVAGDTGEYESGTPTAEAKERKAEFLGLKMVKSNDKLLLCDLDSDAHMEVFNRSYAIITESEKNKLLAGFICTTSIRGRKHAYVKLRKPLGLVERIGLQAVLGSDAKREALSVLEWLKGYEEPTVLFETPEEYERVMTFINA
jgi:hypothetical protein